MDGLHALVEMSVADDLAEGAQLLRLVRRVHGAIGVVPVAQHAQSLEVHALQFYLLLRIGATRGAKGRRVELLARAAVLLLHLQLDGQTMAVPTRDVRRIEPVQRARLDDDVLENLVDGMADVNGAVGVGRPIVEHEARPAACGLALFPVSALLVPPFHHSGLALREIRLHGEIRLRQVDRVFVVSHVFRSSVQYVPRFGGIPVNLLDESVERREVFLVAQLRHELYFDLPAV
jgi:hypothetical protein